MILSFQLRWSDGTPTHFMERIAMALRGPGYHRGEFASVRSRIMHELEVRGLKANWDLPPKLHTIRVDKGDRWTGYQIIHPVIDHRKPSQCQFMPEIQALGVESFSTKLYDGIYQLLIGGEVFYETIDGAVSHDGGIQELATNDGFDTVDAFLAFFKPPFSGKIIHWTDKRYDWLPF